MLPTLCHTQNAGKMTKKNPLAFDHSFQLLLLHYLLRTCSLPDISDTDVNKVGKGHDTYIPSSITYNLKSGNGTITAPTWWDWYENEVNTCSALKAMLVEVPATWKSALLDSRGESGNLGQSTVSISTRYVISGAGLLICIVRKTIILILHRVVMSIKQYICRLKRYLHIKIVLLSDGIDGFA